MTGKGSARRPNQVSDEIVQSNWDRIFGAPVDALKTDSISPDRYLEETDDIGNERKLHQDKIGISEGNQDV